MRGRLSLYLKYVVRSLRRERRSLFAAFAIAVGVAAIVGLQSLGLSIEDRVTRDVRATQQADIVVASPGDIKAEGFSPQERAALDRLASQGRFADWTYFFLANPNRPSFIAAAKGQGSQPLQWLQPYLIEPEKYPLYGEVRALRPKDVPLSRLLTSPGDMVLSRDVAARLRVDVGDEVTLENSATFVVRGIVRNDAAGGFFAPYFVPPLPWFGYLSLHDRRAREVFSLDEGAASLLFIRTRDEAETERLAGEIRGISRTLEVETAAERLPELEDATGTMSRFILTSGLVSLVIGGIGILNTMLVVVGRRSTEVAILKALGLKGRQVVLLFLMEGAILGVAGSIAGVLLGILLSYLLTGFAGPFLQADLPWSLHLRPIFTGMAVGVITTVVFSFLPILAASRIRPNALLQPQATVLPRAGRLLSVLVVLVLTAVIGLVASELLDNLLIGVLGAYGVLVVLAVLGMVLLGVVWAVGRLPSFGSINLKMALRGLSRHKGRSASTLLALIAGLFAMSSIVILGSSLTRLFDELVEEGAGGNIVVFLLDPDLGLRDRVQREVSAHPDVSNVLETQTALPKTLLLNGRPIPDEQMRALLDWRPRPRLIARSGAPPGLDPTFVEGRGLGPQDADRPVVVVGPAQPWLHAGDRLTFGFDGRELTLEVVGVTRNSPTEEGAIGFDLGNFLAPLGAIEPAIPRDSISFALTTSEAQASAVAARLNRSLPRAVALETTSISSVFKEVFQRFTVFPTVLSGLALFAGAVIIANSVALATMERRRETALMKSVGAKGSRVLITLLLENGILGLVGGAIGVGLSLVILALFNRLEPEVSATPDALSIIAVLSVAIGVALGAAVLSAWPASRERPLTVLRYE